MASLIPTEGRDYLLGRVPQGGTSPANLYLGLFTGASASTTPAATAVLSTSTGVTEASFTSYARVAVAAADWASPATETLWSTSARVVTATQKAFAAAGASYATAINGFFLASASTAGVAVYYSNFTDTTAIASLALGDIVRVTPKFGLAG
jgi:hypothetical protein